MSIDAVARTAVQDLTAAVAGRGPVLADIERRGARRRHARQGAFVTITAVVVALGLALGLQERTSPPPPAHPDVRGMSCQLPGITCIGPRMHVAGILAVPVSFVPAAGVDTDDISPGMTNLEVHRKEGGTVSGLTVFEEPCATDGDRDHPASELQDASAGTVAHWLARRSFLVATEPEQATISGIDAWRVSARMRPGAGLPSFADAHPAALTFLNGDGFGTGGSSFVSEHLTSSYYYLLDLPGHGLVVIWVWTWEGGQEELDRMDAMVASLRFG